MDKNNMPGRDTKESDSGALQQAVMEGSKELKSRDKRRITTDINQSKISVKYNIIEMLAVLELIGLYSDVNQEIIDKNLHPVTPFFISVTSELKQIKAKLQSISIISPTTQGEALLNPRFENLWNFYRKDLVEEN